MCKMLVTCVAVTLNRSVHTMVHKLVAYQPGIDESKIDGLSLSLAFHAIQGTRSYDTRPELRRICYMYKERDVNRR